MFENTPPTQNPLNPIMPAPGMTSAQATPPAMPLPETSPIPSVHTMPEKFRTAGAGGGPKGSGTTKKLLIILGVVVVVAGLGIGALYVFSRAVKTDVNNANGNTNIVTNALTNLNTNMVINENLNTANTNTASNLNIVTNLNTTNTNITNGNNNTNTTNTNTTNANSNTPVTATMLPSTTDTDSDGLTNVEETLYTTDSTNPDTDGDGFLDGKIVRADGSIEGELYGLYNPKGTGKLEGSALVKVVKNASNTYSILAPTSWTTNESSGLLVITPAIQTGEFFQVRVYDNATRQTPQAWYLASNPQAQVSALKSVTVNGLEGIITEDGTTVYLFKEAKVYGLSYVTGTLTELNYWTTFSMMMRSFKLVAAS